LLLSLLFNVSLGIALSLCARDRVRADGPLAAPAIRVLLVFTGMVVVPFTLYLYAIHPSWTWMYLVDPSELSGLVVVPAVCAHGGVLLGGWYLGSKLVRAGKVALAGYLAAGGGLLVLLGTALLWGRLGRYGSYQDYLDERAIPIMQHKLGYVLVVMVVGGLIAASFVAVELVRDSKRVRSR
jgi:hypothetical protein